MTGREGAVILASTEVDTKEGGTELGVVLLVKSVNKVMSVLVPLELI